MHTVITPPPLLAPEEKFSAEAVEKLREELEVIGYVTSHDLLAPLRSIQSSCEELQAQLNEASDPAQRNAVRMIQQEAARLKLLMEGVVEFIRLETFPATHKLLDCSEILQTAKTTLAAEIKATDAIIISDALPQVSGHRARLIRLFAHLLDNALKFHGESQPKVHISARYTGDAWEFCVEDNGIGIEEENHEIIFRLFHRLHTHAYPGHGIGLTLSRKIVEAHGGKMWVESTLGKGSRVFFTLASIENNGSDLCN